MGVIWIKLWFDLWHNKTRTLLAVLSISAGVFAVGTFFGMSDLLTTNLDKSHFAVLPPHLEVIFGDRVDLETLNNLKTVPGVEDIEPYNSVSVLYKVNPQSDWRQGNIHMRGDFNNQKYELVQLREGRWPKKNEIGIERMAAQFLNVGIGDSIILKINDTERTFPITGLIRHPFVPPPQFMDLAFFFMNGQGLERFGISEGTYNSVYVRVAPYSSDYTKEIASRIKEHLAKQNIRVAAFLYQDPTKHWGRTFFDGFTLVLKVLALICVVMSAVLVYNTLSNLITQQTNQIGVLKAIGGKSGTIIRLYLASALVYGFLALIIALPLATLTAYIMTKTFLNLFNIDYNQMQMSTQAVVFQVLSALVMPLLAGLVPTLQGAAITVRQAIASYGLGMEYRSDWLNRFVERIGQRWLPSHYATALGNMFHRRGRLLLTQVVLIAAGTAFLLVMSLMSSINITLDHNSARNKYDTLLQFNSNERKDRIESLAYSVEGVKQVELRLVQPAGLFVAGQLIKEAGIGSNIEGISAKSDFYKPLIVSGRWIVPEDDNVVVIPRETGEKNHINLGDVVTLDLGELGKDNWKVVGYYEPMFVGGFSGVTIYAPLNALFDATKKQNQGSLLYVRTTSHDPSFITQVTLDLKNLYDARNMKVIASQTEPDLRKTNEFQFSTVTSMLLGLAIIVAVVGGIALMGALSIGVVERTKEIGVLRAIGARSSAIMGIFIMEGVFQGLLSWSVSVPLSFLISQPISITLGKAMVGAALDYQYNWFAVGVWFVIILIISIMASVIPALSATRISVRDSLAYA